MIVRVILFVCGIGIAIGMVIVIVLGIVSAIGIVLFSLLLWFCVCSCDCSRYCSGSGLVCVGFAFLLLVRWDVLRFMLLMLLFC